MRRTLDTNICSYVLRRHPASMIERFAALDLGPATLSPADLGPALLEPHASWMTRIAADWVARYGVAQ